MSGSNLNLSAKYCVEPDCITEKPIVVKSESARRKSIFGVYSKSLSISSVISRTCFFGSSSLKYIHIKFKVISPIASIMIHSIPKSFARTHHIAGPTKNALPKAAPISPIFFALVSFVEMSDIYACTTPKPEPPIPEIRREKRYSQNPKVAML